MTSRPGKRRLSEDEFDQIHSRRGRPSPSRRRRREKVPGQAPPLSADLGFLFGKFLTDGIWWFYLFWLPDYLRKQFAMTTQEVRLPTFIVYGVAVVGSIHGGSIPLSFMKRGMPVYRARMPAMLLIAFFPLAVLSTQYFGNVGRFGNMAAALLWARSASAPPPTRPGRPTSSRPSPTCSRRRPWVGDRNRRHVRRPGRRDRAKAHGLAHDVFPDAPDRLSIMFMVCALSYLVAWAIMKILVPGISRSPTCRQGGAIPFEPGAGCAPLIPMSPARRRPVRTCSRRPWSWRSGAWDLCARLARALDLG